MLHLIRCQPSLKPPADSQSRTLHLTRVHFTYYSSYAIFYTLCNVTGDRGFDPLGLSKPVEYLQVDVDELDQNAPKNKPGAIIGQFENRGEQVSAADSLQPYDEVRTVLLQSDLVPTLLTTQSFHRSKATLLITFMFFQVFGLERFRECELIHGRWAMLACLGCIVAEGATGVSWVEAGKVELDGASYFGQSLPFSITQLVWIEALLVGGAEVYRNTELDTSKRCYPGGVFDPLNLAEGDKGLRLKEAEIKHARLAMVAFLGYGVQALVFGEGCLGSLALFAKNLSG